MEILFSKSERVVFGTDIGCARALFGVWLQRSRLERGDLKIKDWLRTDKSGSSWRRVSARPVKGSHFRDQRPAAHRQFGLSLAYGSSAVNKSNSCLTPRTSCAGVKIQRSQSERVVFEAKDWLRADESGSALRRVAAYEI